MSSARRALLLASIHDVSPRFESEVDHLLDLLRHYVGDRIAMHFDRPWLPGEARASRLVVIGRKGLDRAVISAALESA